MTFPREWGMSPASSFSWHQLTVSHLLGAVRESEVEAHSCHAQRPVGGCRTRTFRAPRTTSIEVRPLRPSRSGRYVGASGELLWPWAKPTGLAKSRECVAAPRKANIRCSTDENSFAQ